MPFLLLGDTIKLHRCIFSQPRMGALALSPHAGSKLALVLVGNSLQGLGDVVTLATPTIPPMTRSPVGDPSELLSINFREG